MSDQSAPSQENTRKENVERILDTAARLFMHYGYAKTNVADIARELSMSPANIYRFFSSKAEIHQAIARRMLEQQYAILAANAKGGGAAAERLKNHLLLQHRITVETMLDDEKVHEMVLVAMDQQWQVIQQHLERVRELIRSIIDDGISAGEFRAQDSLLAAECFMQAATAFCHPQIVSKKLSQDEVAGPDDMAAFILRALV
ncbi:AcrR family transcriptional regulator [Neorhizobium galegae]|uniref:TetR family transcriptional regulator n=1 Tax=Neorhizobium galegae TaxID=399 RepID=UPI001AE5D534|nr:TetR family transcriptional regulator [Neorhizobium galegae]MBP2549906.1 AcrR family transcriptional regulator [Neorhizobium galegae]